MYNIYIYNVYKYTYLYIYTCNHENNVPSWLSPQWLCGNSCTLAQVYEYSFAQSIKYSYNLRSASKTKSFVHIAIVLTS